ncbi:hypothetical protein MRX96_030959 [Rhipicephalus microplus]
MRGDLLHPRNDFLREQHHAFRAAETSSLARVSRNVIKASGNALAYSAPISFQPTLGDRATSLAYTLCDSVIRGSLAPGSYYQQL